MNIQAGKTYEAKNGEHFYIEFISKSKALDPVIGYRIKDKELCKWQTDGTFIVYNTTEYDLIREVKTSMTIIRWVNFYPDGTSYNHASKSLADAYEGKDRIACKEITFTYYEGEGNEN